MIKEWVKELQKIAKNRKITLIFKYKPSIHDPGGISTPNNIIIYLHKHLKNHKSSLFSIFFHELEHINCYRKGIWKQYHNLSNNLNEKEKKAIKYTALKAERWIDNKAAEKMKKKFPKLTYQFSYHGKEGTIWYREWYNKYFI